MHKFSDTNVDPKFNTKGAAMHNNDLSVCTPLLLAMPCNGDYDSDYFNCDNENSDDNNRIENTLMAIVAQL